MKCPKSRFPIQIIVFDELELIIFVSQGFTLSTASLVKPIIELFQITTWIGFIKLLFLDTDAKVFLILYASQLYRKLFDCIGTM